MLLLPIGDEPNDPKRVAWMNYFLIAANVAVFLFVKYTARTDAAFEQVLFRWGYTPAVGDVQTIVTSMFLHAGWLHLFGNMLFLWIFGDNIEGRFGPLGYLLAYLAVGIAATMIFAVFNAGSEVPAVGASGAISGVQGLYFIACGKNRVKMFLWLYVYVRILHVPARLVMIFWFALQDLLPVLLRSSPTGGGVAHMAHLGGFASGLVLMLVLRPFVKRVELEQAGVLTRTDRYHSGRTRRYDRYRRPPR